MAWNTFKHREKLRFAVMKNSTRDVCKNIFFHSSSGSGFYLITAHTARRANLDWRVRHIIKCPLSVRSPRAIRNFSRGSSRKLISNLAKCGTATGWNFMVHEFTAAVASGE